MPDRRAIATIAARIRPYCSTAPAHDAARRPPMTQQACPVSGGQDKGQPADPRARKTGCRSRPRKYETDTCNRRSGSARETDVSQVTIDWWTQHLPKTTSMQEACRDTPPRSQRRQDNALPAARRKDEAIEMARGRARANPALTACQTSTNRLVHCTTEERSGATRRTHSQADFAMNQTWNRTHRPKLGKQNHIQVNARRLRLPSQPRTSLPYHKPSQPNLTPIYAAGVCNRHAATCEPQPPTTDAVRSPEKATRSK